MSARNRILRFFRKRTLRNIDSTIGNARELDIQRVRQGTPVSASVSAWILTGKDWHPFWSQYLLHTAHLRPVLGKKAYLTREGATHELILGALDPEPGPMDRETYFQLRPRLLRPLNISEQAQGLTDEQAADLTFLIAREVIEGGLLAEPDGIVGARNAWRMAIDAFAKELSR